ncbi:aspartyl/asparaginyl beta-hydroxylase domain-containing protein [Streptomyces anulatus]|uniref:aspartyl/asparaginyl beta-hydroxylase domain-containing protein n=1 Tax=Streptomyces anulatus TaxID=1892 RepID=UPI0037A85590|nr:aspartyl/asparaginyl beta-hydroxylase domain-containing protein [Streptomyces anulatus]
MTTTGSHLYESYPYPAPRAGADPINDVAHALSLALVDGDLDGWRVLDAGCGTGHRLVALALQYPGALFTGIDLSEASLAVARELAARSGADNVTFVAGDVGSPPGEEEFDLIVCSGVLHHLPDPAATLRSLTGRLTENGLLYLWLYHALGEHDRMADRELVALFAQGCEGGADLPLVRALGLSLSPTRYGSAPPGAEGDASLRDVLDADAYLNPVVRPLRFAGGAKLCRDASLDWASVLGVTGEGAGGLLDLCGTTRLPFHRTLADLFPDEGLLARAAGWDNADRLAAVELRLRPTGFSLLAGKGDSPAACEEWVLGNALYRQAPRVAPGSGGQSDHDARRRRYVRERLAEPLDGVLADARERWGAAALGRVGEAVEMAVGRRPRVLTDPRQRPALLHFPGLPAEPWVSPDRYPELLRFATDLERHWVRIRDEADRLRGVRGGLEGYVEGEYMSAKFQGLGGSDWLTTPLYEKGGVPADVAEHCPAVRRLLQEHASLLSGDVIVSRVEPGARLAPHVDDNDYKLTLHLGLRIPDDCFLRVDGTARAWQEGRCLVFSDAYEHEVWNDGDTAREILLVDIWHPELSPVERQVLNQVRDVLAPASEPEVLEHT